MTSGIYKITNTITNESYIGKSTNIEKRFESHKKDLKDGNHHNKGLQEDYNLAKSLGADFEIYDYDIIEEVNNKRDLNKKEMFWINEYNTFERGYNRTLGGIHDETKGHVDYGGGRLFADDKREQLIQNEIRSIVSYFEEDDEIYDMIFGSDGEYYGENNYKEDSLLRNFETTDERKREVKERPRKKTFQEKIDEKLEHNKNIKNSNEHPKHYANNKPYTKKEIFSKRSLQEYLDKYYKNQEKYNECSKKIKSGAIVDKYQIDQIMYGQLSLEDIDSPSVESKKKPYTRKDILPNMKSLQEYLDKYYKNQEKYNECSKKIRSGVIVDKYQIDQIMYGQLSLEDMGSPFAETYYNFYLTSQTNEGQTAVYNPSSEKQNPNKKKQQDESYNQYLMRINSTSKEGKRNKQLNTTTRIRKSYNDKTIKSPSIQQTKLPYSTKTNYRKNKKSSKSKGTPYKYPPVYNPNYKGPKDDHFACCFAIGVLLFIIAIIWGALI